MNYELTPLKLFGGLANSLNANLSTEIISTNEKSREYGLALTADEAQMLVCAGRSAIDEQDRIEIGKSATVKLIEKFMQSSYIQQKDYAQTLAALLDVFYTVKEESTDTLSDDLVIDTMFYYFERDSGGDIDTLCNRDMERLCRRMRSNAEGCSYDMDESFDDEYPENREKEEWEEQ